MLCVLISMWGITLAQTEYPDRLFFELTVAKDGRVEALINANDRKWMTVYRNFIELNVDTQELVLAFDVAASDYPSITALKSESHIMTSKIGSGENSWALSENVTENAEGYIHSNMVLWYDKKLKEMVMIFQSSSYWYWHDTVDLWYSDPDLDAYDQTLQLMRHDENGWRGPDQILEDLDNPHVHFQIMESIKLDDEGFPMEVMLPVHHLSESEASENYEMVARTDRSLSAENQWDIRLMSATEDGGNGYLQSSIVRVPGDNKIGSRLVAFLRDANGYWVYRSTSDDDGLNWTDPVATALPNPDQMSQAVYLHSGFLMLIYNPTQSMTTAPSAGDRYSNCHHLAVGLSIDNGLTWQHSRMLEYAYDGMFNYPVALQDPTCANIYVTYSVQSNEDKGCSLLEECSDYSQDTMAYIKFTIITEKWVMNNFDYQYDTSEMCTWRLSPSLTNEVGFERTMFDSESASGQDFEIVIVLAVVLSILVLGNIIWCYCLCYKRKSLQYTDLESLSKNKVQEYETTK